MPTWHIILGGKCKIKGVRIKRLFEKESNRVPKITDAFHLPQVSFHGGPSTQPREADLSAYIHNRSRNRSMNVKNPSIAIPNSITNKKDPT